jgi:hypothetical protein
MFICQIHFSGYFPVEATFDATAKSDPDAMSSNPEGIQPNSQLFRHFFAVIDFLPARVAVVLLD